MLYQDRTLSCGDCRESFTFTAGEQEFHASKGFNNDPGRCPSCRAARKQGGGQSGGYSSGGGSFAGFDRQMHDATCAECGQATQVPFIPSGERPVHCRDCYSRQRGGRQSNGGGRSKSRY
jgi:CxxC-x17-CxxC domain-containing protein